ncbi:S8 family serine peptidase [Caenimonas sp. DR4.4]|uniref:S8 family serine peptidase n=2 Tax=Caenimonas aquaedulcis TaxID=2793270 RepID=A0A931H2F8_9BURK|nr:S8 family serine peptidase [Caenimonas aquaedulcis]
MRLAFAALALLGAFGASAQGADPAARHPFRSQPIPGQYIVVFKDGVRDVAGETDKAVRRAGGRRHHTYSKAIKGFSASMSDAAVQDLRYNPNVAYIEQDQAISLAAVETPATWGLDRIDQADRPLDTIYHYTRTGAGVYAFIIDTGIRSTHSEFSGRMLAGFDAVQDGNGTNDCDGHGTHVSGTVGGTTWGVAKAVTLIPVRVLDCSGSGTWSGVIAGIDWVANSPLRPAVANMSLGGGFSASVNAAVANAVAKGVVMVVAAGNENTNACKSSPASEPTAITVGATTSTDARASYSNYGTCVDIFAPGSGITSSWNTSDSATNTISGTSMATPHVTGAAALALEASPDSTPAAVTLYLTSQATPNRLASLNSGSPNLLLYSLADGTPTEPPVPGIAVKSLAGKTAKSRTTWVGQVTVVIRNVGSTTLVPNAVVTGSFAPGGTSSCTTNNKGQCVISSPAIPTVMPTSVFTVTDVTATGKAYDSGENSASQLTLSIGSRR